LLMFSILIAVFSHSKTKVNELNKFNYVVFFKNCLFVEATSDKDAILRKYKL
jgi:hypothetical protein